MPLNIVGPSSYDDRPLPLRNGDLSMDSAKEILLDSSESYVGISQQSSTERAIIRVALIKVSRNKAKEASILTYRNKAKEANLPPTASYQADTRPHTRAQMHLFPGCVVNAFEVMASRFRIFRRAINLQPQNADYVVMACCVQHNFLRDDVIYMTANYVDSEDAYGNITSGQWRTTQDSGISAMFSLQPSTAHNYTRTAAETRDLLCSYFVPT
ncbi:hypothetical protein HPB49_010893 [Dermacentor silvarum]|uniref:Uncharacterized protein n=1 Tax=Dermacentor silvarum TaxID=543639 RepID=A0ACB8DNR9_DERSI|nr:hypothetical protein HPB49_010893 [Dermacentor silvarum]